MEMVKALSIRQPWAWLIVNGFKDVENRSWATGFRGRFLVHTGLTMEKEAVEAVRRACARAGVAFPDKLPVGGIVGEATLVDCVPIEERGWHERVSGWARRGVAGARGDWYLNQDWFVGPYGFILRDARPLPFGRVKGRLGFFEVEEKGRWQVEDRGRLAR